MNEPEIYRALSRYNSWMNQNLGQACSPIGEEARKKPSGAPFGSIHGLWNHLLVADRIWLARFEHRTPPYTALDAQVTADFEALRDERALTDRAIALFVEKLSPDDLSAPFSFTPLTNPRTRTFPFWVCVSHLFNHQTHHRGQISALLEQAGGDCGVTDLLAMPGLEMPGLEIPD